MGFSSFGLIELILDSGRVSLCFPDIGLFCQRQMDHPVNFLDRGVIMDKSL